MYWYSFNDTELKRARSQAETQGEYSDSVDRLKKEVGNLGEVAFWRWCQAYLPDETWEWHNETAWMNGEPETNSYDFDIQGANVDVKTTAQSAGHSARR